MCVYIYNTFVLFCFSVYKNKTSETKATVKNLKPKELSLFASSPNITLEHLHELRIDKKSPNVKSKSELFITEEGHTNQSASKKETTSLIKITPVIPYLVTDKNSSSVQKEPSKCSESDRLLKTGDNSAGVLAENLSNENSCEMAKDCTTSNEFMSEKTAAEIMDELEELDEDTHKEIVHVEELSSLSVGDHTEDMKNVEEMSAYSEEIILKPSPSKSVASSLPSVSVPQKKR